MYVDSINIGSGVLILYVPPVLVSVNGHANESVLPALIQWVANMAKLDSVFVGYQGYESNRRWSYHPINLEL